MPTTKRPVTGKEPERSPVPSEPVSEAPSSPGTDAQAPAPPVPPAPATSAATGPNPRRSRIRTWFVRLVRVAVLVAILVGIGGGIYYGWPIVYDRVIAPVQTNTSDVGALRDRISQLEAQLTELGAADASIRAGIAGLEVRLSEHEARLEALDEMDAKLATNSDVAAQLALRQVRLLKGMELMSRARLFLYQSNYGLAEQDLEDARDLLADIASGGDVDGQAVVAVAVERLGRAIDALPAFPVAASGEVDIAWQALLGRVPSPEPTTNEPSPGPTTNPAPTPSPEVSPTP